MKYIFLIILLINILSSLNIYAQYENFLDIKVNDIEFVYISANKKVYYFSYSDNGIKEPDEDFLKDYYIGKYEVTNNQFAEFLNEKSIQVNKDGEINSRKIIKSNRKFGLFYNDGKWICRKGYEDYPVNNVSWYGAMQYCDWLSLKTNKKISLPTKNQWLFAASETSNIISLFSGTNNKKEIKKYAWTLNNTLNKPQKVGTKLPNILGIYDMTGNVKELCYSYEWHEQKMVTVSDTEDPMTGGGGSHEELQTFYHLNSVARGGSWSDTPNLSKNSDRPSYSMNYLSKDIGFRICINL